MDLAGELAAWATATGAVIAAIGLLLTARQLKIQNRQHRLDWGMAYSVRFWAIEDELTMVDPANDPERYMRLQRRYLRLREDEFDAARLGWLDASQWTVWHSAYLRPRVREEVESAIAQHGDGLDLASLKACLGQTKSTGSHASSDCAARSVGGQSRTDLDKPAPCSPSTTKRPTRRYSTSTSAIATPRHTDLTP